MRDIYSLLLRRSLIENIENKTAIHIKDTRGTQKQLAGMMGFLCGLFGLGALSSVIAGDWNGAAGCIGILSFFGILSWLCIRLSPEDVAVLLHDGVVLPSCKTQPEFKWSEVECIRWPKGRDSNGHFEVRIALANKSCFAPGIPLGSGSISLSDRLTLIRYLRLVGNNIPQENWSRFCEWCAVPTLEECQKRNGQESLNDTDRESPRSFAVALLRKFSRIGKWSPFILGLLGFLALPVVGPLFMASIVSRKAWWTISVLLGISAAINLPLLLGWNWHTAILLMVFFLVPWILGLFAAPADETSKDPAQHVPGATVWVVVAFIGVPFLLITAVNGWIPPVFAKYILIVFMFMFMPASLILAVRRKERLRNLDKEEREAAALQRWAAYEIMERSSDMPASG